MKKAAGLSRIEWGTGALAALLLGLVATPLWSDLIQERGHQVKAVSNCRQIIIAMKLYAADHQGDYPTKGAKTANEAFRSCFREQILDNEVIFGCGLSAFAPDGNIGKDPDFNEAVKAGENHWAVTEGATDSSRNSLPLVYESPSKAVWPPQWNTTAAGRMLKGRVWTDGAVVIGLNDGSTALRRLRAEKGSAVSVAPEPATGKTIFESHENYTVLDAEVAGGSGNP